MAQQKLASKAQATAGADKAATEPPKKIDTGTLAAIGLVLATLLGAVGTIFAAILKLPMWQIPLVMVGIMLAISLPSMFIAYLKLRKRNLGPILDANGWAINNVAKMNIPFGRSLTDMPQFPSGSERSFEDPYAEKRSPWPKIIIVLIILAVIGGFWYFGKLDKVLPGKAKSTDVLGTNAPAYKPPTNAAPAATPKPAARLSTPSVGPEGASKSKTERTERHN